MEKILIVEDNKALAKLFSKKITTELPFEVDVAYTMKEAEAFIASNEYFLALLDLSLPDALNGEIVDFVLGKSIPSVVLTANIDKKTRESITKKDIIDYVSKEGVEDINYAISIIERVSKNRKHKVLIADDSQTFRNIMKKMLQNLLFDVYVAAHGEEALNTINEHPDIKLVVTDYNMPVINGLELTSELRKTYSKEQLGIIAISSSGDSDVSAKFLKKGASDFIIKPFSKEELTCRIHNTIEALENIEKIMNLAIRDLLTGAYNRRYFYDTAKEHYANALHKGEQMAIAIVCIDHIREINDKYGHDAGDTVIKRVSKELEDSVKKSDIVARFADDEFCVFAKNISDDSAKALFDDIQNRISKISVKTADGKSIKFTVSIGLATKAEDTLEEMIDQADMQLHYAKRD